MSDNRNSPEPMGARDYKAMAAQLARTGKTIDEIEG